MRDLSTDVLQEQVRGLAGDHADGYSLLGDQSWWHFEPVTGQAPPRQGWKIHVSAVPVAAPETLRRVAAIVLRRGLPWKVTRSVDTLIAMCAPPSPLSQVGKFITVYAGGEVADLAEELHRATADLTGPLVPSDLRYRPGSNVYLRYGAFAAQATFRGADQVKKFYLVDPAGRRVEDERAPGRAAPHWVSVPTAPPRRRAPGGQGLFGRDILVSEVLSQSAKGGVYLVEQNGRRAVMKEARIGTCPDRIGRDSRSMLRNEWQVLRLLAGTGLAPEPYDFFFAEDNAYLVEEHLPGETLRRHVERINYRGPVDGAALSKLCAEVGDLVRRIRDEGIVLGDLSPNNIMVDGDRLILIDLEHSAPAGSPEPRYSAITYGYSDPADLRRSLESLDIDRTVAAIAHFVLTGIDPFLSMDEPFGPHVAAALDAFAPGHPDAGAVRARLVPPAVTSTVTPSSSEGQVLEEAVAAGRELVRRVEWDSRPWPWPQLWSPGSVHPASFMSGTAGIVRYYLDLWRATSDREWRTHAADLLAWTVDSLPFIAGESPPGLYFGYGALPWLMAELGAAGDDEGRDWSRRAIGEAAVLDTIDPDNWDVTHGRAGLGLTQLAVFRHTGDEAARRAAVRTADTIIAAAGDQDGVPMWSKEDRFFFGYAHGSAGIGGFLLAAGVIAGHRAASDLALATGRALVDAAITVADGRGTSWSHQPGSATVWSHWCNGAAGVGSFLQTLGTVYAEPSLTAAAVRAGRAITEGRPFGSSCRCHGLAGDGDYLLDLAADARYGEEFRAGAARVGRKLNALRIDDGVAVKWAHEGNGAPRPGFMRGYTGIHSFRLRLFGLIEDSPLTLPVPTSEEST